MSRRKKITISGKNIDDFRGVSVSEAEYGAPVPRTVRETVPYRDGSYDFSTLDGKMHYDDRTLTYTLNVIGQDAEDLGDLVAAVTEWLATGTEIWDEHFPGWYFRNVRCTGTELEIVGMGRRAAKLTATFTAYPYMKAVDTGEERLF